MCGRAKTTSALTEVTQEYLRRDIPRDNPVPIGKPLSSPGIPETWQMRASAQNLTIGDYPAGPETVLAALTALRDTNQPAYLFQRYGRLTRVVPDEHGLPTIADVSQSALKGMLARSAMWQAEALVWGQAQTKRIQPPGYVVEDIASHGDWPLPALKGISATPILRKDGSLHSTPGYDAATGFWYEPSGVLANRPFIPPEHITREDIARAVQVLDDWLFDFPFAGPAETAHALAFFLTLLARSAIDGNTPLGLIVATKSRTGKTLLIEALLLAILGTLPALTSVPTDEAEMRKLLASYALHGKSYVVFDNVNGTLDSASLASILTTGMVSDRILKTNDAPDMRAGYVMAATGNQLEATTELLARSYRCLLDARASRPQDRKIFRHENILGFTRDHRHELLLAGFTLLCGYIQAGMPGADNLPRKGGYEEWVRLIGGALSYAEISGFLENEADLSASADEGESEMVRFLSALLQVYGHRHFRAAQLFGDAAQPNNPLSGALPVQLAEVQAIRSSFTTRAGLLLKKLKGVHYGSPDMWITAREDKHANTTAWCVVGGDVSQTPLEDVPLTVEQEEAARKILGSEEAANE